MSLEPAQQITLLTTQFDRVCINAYPAESGETRQTLAGIVHRLGIAGSRTENKQAFAAALQSCYTTACQNKNGNVVVMELRKVANMNDVTLVAPKLKAA